MSDTKSLKEVSIREIERVIAEAISGLTGTTAKAEISSLSVNTSGFNAINGQDCFVMDIKLLVGSSYSGTADKDMPF